MTLICCSWWCYSPCCWQLSHWRMSYVERMWCWRSKGNMRFVYTFTLYIYIGPWTTLTCQETLDISGDSLHQHWKAMWRGDPEEYWRLAGPRRRSLRHDKQQWAEQIASSGRLVYYMAKSKMHLASSANPTETEAHDHVSTVNVHMFAGIWQASVLLTSQENFINLHPPPLALLSEAAASTPDPLNWHIPSHANWSSKQGRQGTRIVWCLLQIHSVPKKTCDYIFYNNFNNRCPITIIFGIVSSKSMRHRKMVSFPTSPI